MISKKTCFGCQFRILPGQRPCKDDKPEVPWPLSGQNSELPPKKVFFEIIVYTLTLKRVPMKAEHGYLYGWGHHVMWENSHVRKNHLVLRVVGSVTPRYP